MRMFPLFVYLTLTYLVAAVPFGLVLTTLYGGDVDVRASGSGNIGTTNVARVYGWRLAAPALALDLLKGLVPTLVAVYAWPDLSPWWPQVVALTAVGAHVWSVFLDFKGGKGVATGGGALLALAPAAAGLAVAAWGAIFLLTRRSSVSALGAVVVLLVAVGWMRLDLLPVVGVVSGVVVWRHLGNIRRLVDGQEEPLVTWGRARATEASPEELLQQGPAGLPQAPSLWRDLGSDPLEPTEEVPREE